LVAERLRAIGIPVRINEGNALDLLSDFDAADRIILVDAVITGRPTGTITRWDAHTERIPVRTAACSTHWVGVAEAIELARILEQMPAECTVIGIESGHFDSHCAPSPQVIAAVETVVQQVLDHSCILVANVPRYTRQSSQH
jgi:hydrogenase maturation protease